MAITLRGDRPAKVVFPSDRGTQYASAQITAFAAANGLIRSMGLTGIYWDNSMAESFFCDVEDRVLLPAGLAHQEAGPGRGGRVDRGPLQPASTPRVTRSDQPRGLRTAILTPDRGLSKSRITRVHETGAGPDGVPACSDCVNVLTMCRVAGGNLTPRLPRNRA